jgi:hypothetical protein
LSVGEGVLAQALQRLGDHEQRDDPTSQISDRVQKAVVAEPRNHPANAQKRRRRQVIATKCDPVHKPVDLTAGGKIPRRRPGSRAEVKAQTQRQGDE